jgi:hypothetical protein
VSEASVPAERAGNEHGDLYEPAPIILSDGQRAQTPETRTVPSEQLDSEEPAPRHMDAPAEFAIKEGEYRTGQFN